MSPLMISHLNFLLDQPPKQTKLEEFSSSPEKELISIKKILEKKQFKAVYVDISPDNFKRIGCFIYRVVIPQLQPLYLRENQPEVRLGRIKQVAKHFNILNISLNKIPHPLLLVYKD